MGGRSAANQDDSSLLEYIIYLKKYLYLLEDYLRIENEEFFFPNHKKCILLPMSKQTKNKLTKEINEIKYVLNGCEKFRRNTNCK